MSDTFEPDALSVPFWDAARERRLVIQRCRDCGAYQFYARPFCLACESLSLTWVDAAGTGTVYSATTVRVRVRPELDPPYDVALIELDEGPRMLSIMAAGDARIGERVQVAWRDRGDDPPLPNFVPDRAA